MTLINKLKWTCLLCIRVTMNNLTTLASKTKDYLVNKELQDLRDENKMLKERIQKLEKPRQNMTRTMCSCGVSVHPYNINRHNKTKKHLKIMEMINN